MVIHGESLSKPTYKVIQTTLDEGSTAICSLVEHEIFQRKMVQKTITLSGLPDALARSEPKLLDEFDHPSLVKVYEAQWDPDHLKVNGVTFIMPYHDGESVKVALMDGYPFSIGTAISVTCNVLSALHYLHIQHRILHRDVKPGNIFLDADRQVGYLGDLGSAASMSKAGRAEARGGTPLYRAPECTADGYSVHAELYSVGLVLFEMLNGRFRYEDIDEDQVLRRNTDGRRALPHNAYKHSYHVPGQLRIIVNSLINESPTKRPPSAAAAQRQLEQVPHLDWRREGEPGQEIWLGRKTNRKTGKERLYRIRVEEIAGGRHAGDLKVTSQWCNAADDSKWRGIGIATLRCSAGDHTAVREAFDAVSNEAHRWAAR